MELFFGVFQGRARVGTAVPESRDRVPMAAVRGGHKAMVRVGQPTGSSLSLLARHDCNNPQLRICPGECRHRVGEIGI